MTGADLVLARHTADRALANKEAITILQDVVHDQQQLIASLQQQIDDLRREYLDPTA